MFEQEAMDTLTARIRTLVGQQHFSEAEEEIARAMSAAPHAAQPHNLMGIVSAGRGDHIQAMKHFRAAWALDPTYLPARVNMERYGSFSARLPRPAFDETDCTPCPEEKRRACWIAHDAHGVGHVIREV